MIEKLNLWHSCDVDEKKKINELIDLVNAQQIEVEKLKLEFGGTDND